MRACVSVEMLAVALGALCFRAPAAQFDQALPHVALIEAITWDRISIPTNRIPVYSLKSSNLAESTIQLLTRHFGIQGAVEPIPPELNIAPGKWVFDNGGFAERRRAVYFSERTGGVGYFTGDDGHRWDPVMKQMDVEGVPPENEAILKAAEVARDLFGFSPQIDRKSGKYRYKHGYIRTRQYTKGNPEAREVIKRREITLYQMLPNRLPIVPVGSAGTFEIAFVSQGKIADMTCNMFEAREEGYALPKDRLKIEQELLLGRARSFEPVRSQDIVIESLEIVYLVTELKAGVGTAWPFYRLKCLSRKERKSPVDLYLKN